MPRYPEEAVRAAVTASLSYAETLRKLGLCATGGNWHTLYSRNHVKNRLYTEGIKGASL